MRRSHWLWPIVIVASAIGTGLVTFGNIQSPIRFVIAWWFLFVCPGMSFVRLLHLHDRVAEWSLAIALSFTLDALTAGAMIYSGTWSPPIGLAVLIGLCVIGVILQIKPLYDRPLRSIQQRFTAVQPRGSRVIASIVLLLSLGIAGGGVIKLAETPVTKLPSKYQRAVLADKPVSYWRLNETGGATTVDSADGNLGVIKGNVTFGVPGAIMTDGDTAMAFDGSSGYISIVYNDSLDFYGDFTIEAWAKPEELNQTETVLHKGRSPATDNWQYRLGLTARNQWRGSVRLNGITYDLIQQSTASLDTWVYLALTRSGDTLTFYVNGLRVATAIVNGKFSPSTGIIAIGRTGSTSSGYFKGSIDEVAIYNTALPAGRILEHYNAAGIVSPPPTSAPTPTPTETPRPTRAATPTNTPKPPTPTNTPKLTPTPWFGVNPLELLLPRKEDRSSLTLMFLTHVKPKDIGVIGDLYMSVPAIEPLIVDRGLAQVGSGDQKLSVSLSINCSLVQQPITTSQILLIIRNNQGQIIYTQSLDFTKTWCQ